MQWGQRRTTGVYAKRSPYAATLSRDAMEGRYDHAKSTLASAIVVRFPHPINYTHTSL